MLIGKSLKTFEINGSLISSNIQLKPKGKLKCYVQCICLFDLLSSFHSSWHYVCFGRVSGAAPKHKNLTALSRRAPCRALPHWLLTLSSGTHLLHHQAHRHNADDVHVGCRHHPPVQAHMSVLRSEYLCFDIDWELTAIG